MDKIKRIQRTLKYTCLYSGSTNISVMPLNLIKSQFACTVCGQGRPVNVKHDARCVMGKVGEDKKPKRGGF